MFFHVIFALPVLPEGVHAYQCTNGNSFLGAGVALTGTLGVHVCEPPTQPHPREAHMGLSPGWRGPGEASPVEAPRCLVSESILFRAAAVLERGRAPAPRGHVRAAVRAVSGPAEGAGAGLHLVAGTHTAHCFAWPLWFLQLEERLYKNSF